MSKKERFFVLAFTVVAWVVGMSYLLKADLLRQEYNRFEDRGLPRINIELNGVELEGIKEGLKDLKYENNEIIIYSNGEIDNYSGIEIKGRGNSTWLQPKKPFQIKFANGVDLFGMGKAKKWVLLANYLDPSFMRNDAAFVLAEMLEERYNSRGEFVELYFNGKYEGLYYLIKKIDISKTSVDLRNNGGVLFEMDMLHSDKNECYTSYLGECMILKETFSGGIDEISVAKGFMNDFDRLERATVEKNYEEIKKIADIESFAKYYIINEFSANPDAYSSSFYFYRNGFDDKIHAGPVWDFDYAFGNLDWGWYVDEGFFSPTGTMIRKKEAFSENVDLEKAIISKLVYHMMEIPEFKKQVSRIFQEELSGRKNEFVSEIIEKRKEIEVAALIDMGKWETNDGKEGFNKLIEWLKTRYDYFEQVYGKPELFQEILR